MYKNKPVIIGFRPWWKHPSFPWGVYSVSQDKIKPGNTLSVEGYHSAGDGGGGEYHASPLDVDLAADGFTIIDGADRKWCADFKKGVQCPECKSAMMQTKAGHWCYECNYTKTVES